MLWRAPARKAERVLGRGGGVSAHVDAGVGGGRRHRPRACATAACAGAVAGKTGTTNDGTDVWFVGYTPTVVAGGLVRLRRAATDRAVASGGRLAAPAWAAFYLDGWLEREPADWTRPPAW